MADALMAGRRQAPQALGDVCVLGLGITGRAVLEYLMRQPKGRLASLTVFTGTGEAHGAQASQSEQDAFLRKLEAAGASIVDSAEVTGRFDLAVVSPGIPETSPFYASAKAASAELISEVELAWRESPADALWAGVTGTNGKTTTTALLTHLLNAGGFSAVACGNIGQACLDAVAADVLDGARECDCGRQRVYVAEVSSYQLASIVDFAPDAAIFLGVTPDHLAWHGSMEAYAAAKMRMLSTMERAGGVAVLDAGNDLVREQIRRLRKAPSQAGFSYIPLGTKDSLSGDMRAACGAENAAFLDGAGHLHVAFQEGEYVLCAADELQIKGAHNVLNALAAASAALALGAEGVAVAEALADFKPLEHRIEPCGTADGVDFYNDSKATNVDATLMALASFPGRGLVVMLGGQDKMGPLDELVSAAAAHAKAVIVFGEAAERFDEAFKAASVPNSPALTVRRCATFDEAFEEACCLAEPEDVVLLSPACASFDEFTCFEARGDHFKDLVAARAAAQANASTGTGEAR